MFVPNGIKCTIAFKAQNIKKWNFLKNALHLVHLFTLLLHLKKSSQSSCGRWLENIKQRDYLQSKMLKVPLLTQTIALSVNVQLFHNTCNPFSPTVNPDRENVILFYLDNVINPLVIILTIQWLKLFQTWRHLTRVYRLLSYWSCVSFPLPHSQPINQEHVLGSGRGGAAAEARLFVNIKLREQISFVNHFDC